ncbi:MAG: M15 family metallopeptidase [Candidatus Uhrbacteria bacterium]|nr:M15 family metallopeptidase [Candidatus Uhrbacteria bacterium]
MVVPDQFVFINNTLIQAVEVKENGEKMVDLLEYAKERNSALQTNKGVTLREGVADKLINAQMFLPDGYNLFVVEGYRSPEDQAKLWQAHRNDLQKRHSDWDEAMLNDETSKLYSPAGSVMPHSVGSAVDLTVVDSSGSALDMGTDINVDAEKTEYRTYTYSDKITEEQSENRKLLIDAMNAGQFVNYSTEWWHWSTGDQYWAFILKQPFAVYGTLNEAV